MEKIATDNPVEERLGQNQDAKRRIARFISHFIHDNETLMIDAGSTTREIARMHAALAFEVRASGHPARPPVCLITGGETTVTLRGKGKGGRNQEFALASALDIAGLPDVVVLSAGTDGTDGPTDAAGALVDGDTVTRALGLGLKPRAALDGNDAYPFFERLGDLVTTGPTRTNVMDVRLVLVG